MTGSNLGTLVRSARTANVIPCSHGPELRARKLPNDQAKKNTAGLSAGWAAGICLPDRRWRNLHGPQRPGITMRSSPRPGARSTAGSRGAGRDDDIRRVRPLLTRTPLGLQRAVYSTTGLPGLFPAALGHNSDAPTWPFSRPIWRRSCFPGASRRGRWLASRSDARRRAVVGDLPRFIPRWRRAVRRQCHGAHPGVVGPAAQAISEIGTARRTSASANNSPRGARRTSHGRRAGSHRMT